MQFNVFTRHVSRIHKIVGLVAGILLTFWVVSGFYFTLYPIENIRGDHLRAPIEHGTLEPEDVDISVQEAIDASGIWGFQAELKMFLGDPVWVVSNSHDTRMIDARTGEKISPIPEETARRIAETGVPGLIGSDAVVYMISENPLREYGGALPVWIAETPDAKERVYIDPMTGDIKAVRTTEWRIFDVLWRFHILDITGADEFDTWWLKLGAFLGIVMVISGLIILVQRAIRGRLFF